METLGQPTIVKRFTRGGDPNVFTEVIQDRQSNTKWVKLWVHQDQKWFAFEFDKNRAYLLESMLNDTRKVLR